MAPHHCGMGFVEQADFLADSGFIGLTHGFHQVFDTHFQGCRYAHPHHMRHFPQQSHPAPTTQDHAFGNRGDIQDFGCRKDCRQRFVRRKRLADVVTLIQKPHHMTLAYPVTVAEMVDDLVMDNHRAKPGSDAFGDLQAPASHFPPHRNNGHHSPSPDGLRAIRHAILPKPAFYAQGQSACTPRVREW